MSGSAHAQPSGDEPGAANWWRVAIGAGAAMFLCMGLGRFSYSAMIPALVDAGELDAVLAGYIGGANMVGFLIGAATSTLAARLFKLDRLLWLSIAVAIVGLAASAIPFGGLWLGAWRAAIGVATGFVMVLGLALTAQTAPPERRATAMSYIFVGVGCGILFGGTAVPASLQWSVAVAWWSVAAAGLVAGLVAIVAWSRLASVIPPADSDFSRSTGIRWPWLIVIAASFLFSFGIVPHTIYWFDYIARDLGHGYPMASWHWAGVGLAAIAGPVLAARLAGLTGTAVATVITYFVMGVGVGMPWLTHAAWALVISTIIFGAQPAVSTLLGAWARDLGDTHEMPGMMRIIILANGIGSGIAGICIPMLLDVTSSYELLFLLGGAALLAGCVLCLISMWIGRGVSRA